MRHRLSRLCLLHDGNISNRNQARALASGLGVKIDETREINVTLPTAELTLTLPSSAKPGDALVIGCGRKTAPLTAAMKRRGWKAVQILHPRLPFTSKDFDCLVLPHHDRLGWFDDESKVIRMDGSLSWGLRRNALDCNRKRFEYWNPKSINANRSVAILLGGSALSDTLQRELIALGDEPNDFDVFVVASRRTPSSVIQALSSSRNFVDVWSSHDFMRRNPYRQILGSCDGVIVGEDSISMVCDALAVHSERGLKIPIFLLEAGDVLKPKHSRFNNRAMSLYGSGLITIFKDAQNFVDLTQDARRKISVPVRQILYEADVVGRKVARLLGLEEDIQV